MNLLWIDDCSYGLLVGTPVSCWIDDCLYGLLVGTPVFVGLMIVYMDCW